MTITKRFMDESSDGSTELFQLPNDFVTGSIWCFDSNVEGETKLREVSEVGGRYYRVTPAPVAENTLMLIYEMESEIDSVAEYGITPWERVSLNKILDLVKAHGETLVVMEEALDNRVSQENFETWATLLEKELADVKAAF